MGAAWVLVCVWVWARVQVLVRGGCGYVRVWVWAWAWVWVGNARSGAVICGIERQRTVCAATRGNSVQHRAMMRLHAHQGPVTRGKARHRTRFTLIPGPVRATLTLCAAADRG